MDATSFLLGALALAFVWYCFTPHSRVVWLKTAIRAEVKQGPTHDKKISALYAIIRQAVQEKFYEDNEITIDNFLRELFEITQYEGLDQSSLRVFADSARKKGGA